MLRTDNLEMFAFAGGLYVIFIFLENSNWTALDFHTRVLPTSLLRVFYVVQEIKELKLCSTIFILTV